MGRVTRRRVLQTSTTLLAGWCAHRLMGPFSVIADPPPWEIPPALLAGEDGKLHIGPMLQIGGSRSYLPRIVAASQGGAWVSWVEHPTEQELLRIAFWDGAKIGALIDVAPMHRRVGKPALGLLKGDPLLLWCGVEREESPSLWLARCRGDGGVVASQVEGVGPGVAYPAMSTSPDGDVWVAWEQRPTDSSPLQVWVAQLNGTKLEHARPVTPKPEGDQRRPAILALPQGRVWVAWDEATSEGSVEIRAALLRRSSTTPQVFTLTRGGLNLAASLAGHGKGPVWLAWYTNVWPDGTVDVPRRVEVAAYSEGRWWRPTAGAPQIERDSRGEVQGFEFPHLMVARGDRLWLTGRASQNFYVVTLEGDRWSPIYRLPKEGWGGRGQHFLSAELASGDLVTARRDLSQTVVQTFAHSDSTPQRISLSPQRSQPPVSMKLASRIDFAPYRDFHFYFGDIHGHTSLSDGTGDVDEYYRMRRDAYELDFASLTDHDNFVGKKLSPSEWEEIKEITDRFNRSGEFVTFFGQEWTSLRVPRGGGHMNVYSTRRDIPLFDHTETAYATTAQLVEAARSWQAIAIPHHIGWTGTVWEAMAPDVTTLVEIISVHGAHEFMGNTPIPHRGGMRGYFVQDGLARGLRFGFIGGTDCHGLAWQHGECWKRDPYRGGWAGVLARELTRDAIFEALRKRRCFATSGIRMRLVFEINDHLMGEEFESQEPVRAFVDVNSESLIRWIEIVKNNETVYRFGGEGHHSTFRWEDPNPTPGTSWYYLRVICRDDNMAWSSPIWVTRHA